MIGRKRFLRIVSVLTVALAAGQLVETLRSSAATDRLMANPSLGTLAVATPNASVLPSAASLEDGSGGTLPEVRGITPVAAIADARGPSACDLSLSLRPAPFAMIDLILTAPCNRGERVVIRHSGLSFTAVTNPDGRLALQFPALETEALVAAYLDGSEIALARVEVPDATAHVRLAVQMAFPARFDLRADEGGQVYVGSSVQGTDTSRRKIIPLGTASVAKPIMAQVYTLPKGDLSLVDLTAEVRITPESCGRTLLAETILSQAGKVTRVELPVTMPLCGTSGDILVLKNLLRDLTLAAPR